MGLWLENDSVTCHAFGLFLIWVHNVECVDGFRWLADVPARCGCFEFPVFLSQCLTFPLRVFFIIEKIAWKPVSKSKRECCPFRLEIFKCWFVFNVDLLWQIGELFSIIWNVIAFRRDVGRFGNLPDLRCRQVTEYVSYKAGSSFSFLHFSNYMLLKWYNRDISNSETSPRDSEKLQILELIWYSYFYARCNFHKT